MSTYRVPNLDEFEWQQAVMRSDLLTPTALTPAKGDRYIIGGTGADGWTGHDNVITYYDGAAWVYVIPLEGWIAWVQDTNKYFKFSGTVWAEFVGATGAQGPQGPQGDPGAPGGDPTYESSYKCLIFTI
jgi:hypothetical protein